MLTYSNQSLDLHAGNGAANMLTYSNQSLDLSTPSFDMSILTRFVIKAEPASNFGEVQQIRALKILLINIFPILVKRDEILLDSPLIDSIAGMVELYRSLSLSVKK